MVFLCYRFIPGILEKSAFALFSPVFLQSFRIGIRSLWGYKRKGLSKENPSVSGIYPSGRDLAGLDVSEYAADAVMWEGKILPTTCHVNVKGCVLMQIGGLGSLIKSLSKRVLKNVLRSEYPGSYTIEMTWVMAVFCFIMVVLIQQAYRLHDETKSGMNLFQVSEMIRHDEDERREEILKEARQRYGLLLSTDNLKIEAEEEGNRIKSQVSGQRKDGPWSLEITEERYEPEEFLRKIAALKQLEERYEGSIQEGDAP